MKSTHRFCLFIAILMSTPCAVAHPQLTAEKPPAEREITPEIAEATFLAVWNAMQDSGALSSMSEVDWQDMREEFEQSALDARTSEELRSVLNQMTTTLGKSHFAIIPREAIVEFPVEEDEQEDENDVDAIEPGTAEDPTEPKRSTQPGDGRTGIDGRFIGDTVLVVAVEPGSPAAKAGITPGWEIVSIRGRDMTEFSKRFGEIENASLSGYHRNAALQEMLTAKPETELPLKLRDLEGNEHELEVLAAPYPAEMVAFGNLPPMPVTIQSKILDHEALAELGIEVKDDITVGFIEFNVWMVPIVQPFAEAIEQFRDANVDCVIIDTRGNPGGIGGLAMGVAGHFTDEVVSLGTMTNTYGELHFNTNPQRISRSGKLVEPLDVPLFILVDEMSASTSEIFAGGLQNAKRANIVGRRTPGLALPAVASDLPNGDIFYHAIADFELPDGRQIEGVGITPDVDVSLDSTAFRHSSDPDIHAALEWLIHDTETGRSQETAN